ncbi:MAG: FAD-dependent oxidoreductase, partial [Gemmatimonadetes bacterium]|nr:FAD-dependent oxidoreductase [Gemmatimonadota bacterium]
FAAGDLADLKQDGKPLPQVAPVAIQSGELAAENTVRSLKGKPLLDFHYRDPGILAVIGRWSAVGRVGKFRFTGLFAWIIWAVVHVLKLVGFRNRLLVLTNWAWNYFSWGRASRLILPSEEPAPGPRETVTR